MTDVAGSARQTSSSAQPGSPVLRAAPGCGAIAFRESDRPPTPGRRSATATSGWRRRTLSAPKPAIALVQGRLHRRRRTRAPAATRNDECDRPRQGDGSPAMSGSGAPGGERARDRRGARSRGRAPASLRRVDRSPRRVTAARRRHGPPASMRATGPGPGRSRRGQATAPAPRGERC